VWALCFAYSVRFVALLVKYQRPWKSFLVLLFYWIKDLTAESCYCVLELHSCLIKVSFHAGMPCWGGSRSPWPMRHFLAVESVMYSARLCQDDGSANGKTESSDKTWAWVVVNGACNVESRVRELVCVFWVSDIEVHWLASRSRNVCRLLSFRCFSL
jgi:hypothetical protein